MVRHSVSHQLTISIGVFYLIYCVQLIRCHRSDVYIAGFFPYGLGKEHSDTGKRIIKYQNIQRKNIQFNYTPNQIDFSFQFEIESKSGRGVMPSVKLALDHVNEHSDILSNYRLHMWWNDTQVNIQ